MADNAHSVGSPLLEPGEGSWDFSDQHNPQPLMWPVCSECDEAYSYTWGVSSMTGKVVWLWRRGCKHKKAAPATHDGRPDRMTDIVGGSADDSPREVHRT